MKKKKQYNAITRVSLNIPRWVPLNVVWYIVRIRDTG